MEFISILEPEGQDEELAAARRHMPDFFLDLNIDQIFKMIQDQAPGYDISQLYYRFPESKEEEIYRREIYRDIKKPEVFDCLDAFGQRMRRMAKALANRPQVESSLQKSAWHASAAYEYCKAVEDLRRGLAGLDLQSRGLKLLRDYLNQYIKQPDYGKLKDEAFHLQSEIEKFHLIIQIENNKVTVTQGTLPGEYDRFLGSEEMAHPSPFASTLKMSPLEETVFSAFRKKYPKVLDEIEKFIKNYPDFGEARIFRLEKELQYYLAFYRFRNRMEDWGILLTEPETDESREMEAEDLYDLALACANFTQNKPVVPNDFVYHENERFFVVNGPNQGGKTTFARSLGQLVYFTKMGFDVPAKRANVHYFTDLLTHFSVEESMETGQGKLMEELSRLAPMMKKETNSAFVIINELFTTAAHYDGCVMGARVLDHFIGAGCRGIYVTHLKELGDSIEKVTSMTAMLDGSEDHRRTFKILRNKAEDVGYAEDIVKKYDLTYEKLSERLKAFSENTADSRK